MNGRYINILLSAVALLMTIACKKEHRPEEETPVSYILLNATEAGSDTNLNKGTFNPTPGTKALLDADMFVTSGNRIQIYDFVTDGTTTTKHIDAYAGPDVDSNSPMHVYGYTWPFEDKSGEPVMYQWIPGTHKFFGWLAKDANFSPTPMTPDTYFDNFTFNENTQTLTIGPEAINPKAEPFDFMYSNVVTTEPQNDPVAMTFGHLFTAVSIGVENSTSSFIKIEDFKIEGIPTTRGASINFGGTATTVTYSAWTEGATFTRGLDTGKAGYEVSPNNLRSNIFDGTTTQHFMMLWPVEAEHLYSTNKVETSNEGVVQYPTDWKMYIKYTVDGKATYEKRINFPNISWEAGNKYHLTIVFADKMVELKTEVKPWEYEEQTINYTDEGVALSAGGALTWDRTVSSVSDAEKMVSIVNAQAAKAHFTLLAPVGGSWIVSLVGDVNAFEVSPSTGIIDTQTATVYVKPLVVSPTRDYKVQLKFTVRRSDGRMIAADNVIQHNGIYTVVLPRNN